MKRVCDNLYRSITYCNLMLIQFQNLKFEDCKLNDEYDKEIIPCRRMDDASTSESYNFPAGIDGGKSGNCPMQNLVEAYETGDERLSVTIAQNGDTKWPVYNKSTLETFYYGANA